MQGRLTSPLRREADGTYTEIDWNTAIAEIAAGFREVIDEHGTDAGFYYGGGGQGNHICGAYGAATARSLGITRRSNALAQEKTGEAYVEGRMFGTHTHGHFADAEVSVFLGKNPWHSHGFDEARRVLKEIAADDSRTMIVIDPRRTETADLADVWLPVKPGGDAYLLAAIIGVVVDESLVASSWLAENATGVDETLALFRGLPIADLAERSGVAEEQIREVARRMASAASVAVYEDLGIEMAPNSTLISYLQRVRWTVVGAYGAPGGMSAHSSLVSLFNYSASGREPTDPVTGSPIISGLVPCNEVADLALTDHPSRVRAMFIESANPVHSLAESDKFRRAMRACDITVVIDIAMTETAEQADYVLPAASQYEKVETTFFGSGFPENWVCLRPPLLEPLGDSLPEPAIHTMLARQLGVLDGIDLDGLRAAAADGLAAFGEAFMAAAAADPRVASAGAVVLYETLGSTLPAGMEGAAALWFAAHQTAMTYPDAVAAAGIDAGDGSLGDALFDAMISSPDGVVFTKHDHADSFRLLKTPEQKVNLAIPELFDDITALLDEMPVYTSDEFPFVLSAGERRGFTANTIMRDPAWRKRDAEGALRLSPADATSLGLGDGDRVRITTPGGSAVAVAEVTDTMMDGHIAIPNGLGLSYSPAGGDPEVTGVAPNQLTTTDWCDPIAKTPWHKHVPARLEAVAR
jgi:anaerobic selenocysteine-containing dehydrogenase